VDDRIAVEITDEFHDALFQLVFRADADVTQDGAGGFGEEPLDEIEPPSEMHSAFNMEPMGWAPAAVVGAALGAPDNICVSLSGDGGFMMNGNEVSTAAQYSVGAIWVVHYNHTLAAVE
jgi:TPP-dependent trihydroxycyclohexane-1,2-dione (THcHDO) dehydratase